jgi:hypothetical protein
MKKVLLLFAILAIPAILFCQNLGINSDGSVPHSSAGLDVKFTDKGLLIPRVSLVSTTSASPVTNPETSLLVYNTATTGDVTPGYYYWNGNAWVRLSVNAGGSGTTNYLPKWNSSGMLGNSLLFDNGSGIGIGTTYVQGKISFEQDGSSVTWGNIPNGITSRIFDNNNLHIETDDYLYFDDKNLGTQMFLNVDDGRLGIGTTTPQNKLDIEGGAVIGATYSGTNTAPTNGLLVEGNVGIGTTSPAANAALDVTSTTKGFLPPRMTTAQRDAISSPVAGLTIYNTSKNCNETYNGTSWVSNTHYIGESYGGGIVFYVYDNGQHGLIAATSDQSTGIRWYGGSNSNTRARADGVGAGLKNTSIIIANQGQVDGNAFAATVCNEYSITVGGVTYGDWYLPSKYELNLLYLQKAVVGGFADYYYWSSSEINGYFAWSQYFAFGMQIDVNKTYTFFVRAVRAF